MLFLKNFIFFCLSISFIHPSQQDSLSFKNKFFIGAAAGAATTIAIEPLIYIKNRYQQNKILNLRQIYRGLPVNATGFIPTMAIQNSVFSHVENSLNKTDFSPISKKIIAAVAAGTASTVTSCPRELLIIQQQNNGGNFYDNYKKLVKKYGLTISWKAGTLVAIRNSSFAGCFFVLTPKLSDKLDTLAPFVSGTVSAIITHPLDTIKTRLQAQPHKNMKQIIQEIYTEVYPNAYFKSGIISFSRGIIPRIVGVATTMTLEYRFRECFTQLYKNTLSKKS